MATKLIACPDEVLLAGGLLVKLRHALENVEEAQRVDVDHTDDGAITALFGEVNSAINAGMLALKSVGVRRMEFADGLIALQRAGHEWQRSRYSGFLYVMKAHNEFRKVLDAHNVANPTDNQIAERLVSAKATVKPLSNWR